LNYDNPLNSEERRYVLVGAAEIDAISPQKEWAGMDAARADRYGVLVWNRFVTHGYGEGRGCRIPYDRYLRANKDYKSVLVEIPDELSGHFKYVCRDFSDDEAATLLQSLAEALERGRQEAAVDWDWSSHLSWVSTALDRAWKNRGLFPGLAAVLETLRFDQAALYVRTELVGKGVQDPRSRVLERLSNPEIEPEGRWKQQFGKCGRVLRVLPPVVKDLLFDRLILTTLNSNQMALICGADLVTAEERKAAGLSFSSSEAIENPYLIVEQYDPPDDEPIPFYRIDNGIFLPQIRSGVDVPGISEFAANDPRRIRAAIFNRLRGARLRGHSFLSQNEIVQFLRDLQLPGLHTSLGALDLAIDLDFYEKGLRRVSQGEVVGWMLPQQKEDDDTITGRIAKLRGQGARGWGAVDWAGLLEPIKDLSPSIVRQARESHVSALERLASRPFSVLTGGAGTGKTTLIATFIKALQRSPRPEKLLLLAPTGKAAVRLKQKIKLVAGLDLEPVTVHSYLVRNQWMEGDSFRLRRSGPPIADGTTTVVIDECSMFDGPLLATVFRALDWTKVSRLILCGDEQQLPPIGVGAPFKNIVDKLRKESDDVSYLQVNIRQIREGSVALKVAAQFTSSAERVGADEILDQLRQGGAVGEDLKLWFFRDENDLQRQLQTLANTCVQELLSARQLPAESDFSRAFDALHGIGGNGAQPSLDAFQILSPYRAGYFGADALNRQMQGLLRAELLKQWSETLGKASGRRYVRNDKVLQTQNKRLTARTRQAFDRLSKTNVDSFVANGELGLVYKIEQLQKERFARVSFETSPDISVKVDGRWAEDWLDLGYAMTVHKAQGSDFFGVLLVVPAEGSQLLLSRELLYTALTRFTHKLFILVQGAPGDITPLERGTWPGSSAYFRRNTSLYFLREAVPEIDDYRPEHRIHKTLRRELVASKSELLIANRLAELNVPYYYEQKLQAADGSIRRPDFTVPVETPEGPDIRYWEHWGMLGNPDYEASMKRRLDWYEKHGLAGKLIQSDERGGFDSTKVDQIIREHLLP
jgi:exodeoxyribonuclease V alpha subunit